MGFQTIFSCFDRKREFTLGIKSLRIVAVLFDFSDMLKHTFNPLPFKCMQ